MESGGYWTRTFYSLECFYCPSTGNASKIEIFMGDNSLWDNLAPSCQ